MLSPELMLLTPSLHRLLFLYSQAASQIRGAYHNEANLSLSQLTTFYFCYFRSSVKLNKSTRVPGVREGTGGHGQGWQNNFSGSDTVQKFSKINLEHQWKKIICLLCAIYRSPKYKGIFLNLLSQHCLILRLKKRGLSTLEI